MKTLDRNDVAHPTNPLEAPSPIEAERDLSHPLETPDTTKIGGRNAAVAANEAEPTGVAADIEPHDGYPRGRTPARSGQSTDEMQPTEALKDGSNRTDPDTRMPSPVKQDLMPGSK